MNAPKMSVVINRTRYDTSKAELIADNVYWDGHNMERSGRNTFLYKTPKGAYFQVDLTMWQGERDTLTPISEEEAIYLFEHGLSEHYVSYAEAFPSVVVQEA